MVALKTMLGSARFTPMRITLSYDIRIMLFALVWDTYINLKVIFWKWNMSNQTKDFSFVLKKNRKRKWAIYFFSSERNESACYILWKAQG